MEQDSSILQLPPPLKYYRLASGRGRLYFGLCPDTDPDLTVEKAREAVFDNLATYLPAPPAKILEVGCGLGILASVLSSKGYTVTSISSSPELIASAARQYGSDVDDFRVLDYFDNDVSIFEEENYDVLFFQNSLQDFRPLNNVMIKARRLLKEKGTIIIGDEVCYDKKINSEISVHMAGDIYTALSEGGFRITGNKKIGKHAVPAYEVAIDRVEKHAAPALSDSEAPNTGSGIYSFLYSLKNQKLLYEDGRLGYEMFVGKKDPFHIRSYEEGDEHEMLAMFNEVFQVDRSLAHWYWKFRDNPYGSHRICLGVSNEGAIVSQYAGYPVLFCSTLENGEKSKCFLTLQAGDTFTHPKVRRIGLGKTGILARTTFYFYAKFLEGFVPFAYGFNTAVIKKLGERYLGYMFGDPVLLWVRDLSVNPFKRYGIFSKLFSGFSVEEALTVGDEWDEFFDRVCPGYKYLLKRDAAYLKWRYLDCPDKDYRIFAVRRRGTLVGWGVFMSDNNTLIWGDALFDNHCLDSTLYLLSYLSNTCFPDTENITAWFSRNPEWWGNYLTSVGFDIHPEPDGLTLCYRIFRNDIMDEQSVPGKLKSHFYYTWGDSDLF